MSDFGRSLELLEEAESTGALTPSGTQLSRQPAQTVPELGGTLGTQNGSSGPRKTTASDDKLLPRVKFETTAGDFRPGIVRKRSPRDRWEFRES